MILKSIKRIRTYIKHYPADKTLPKGDFILVVRNLWKLIDTIYTAKWDSLIFEKEKSLTIRKCVGVYYTLLQAKTAVNLDFEYREEHFYLSTFCRSYSSSHYKYISGPFSSQQEH